MRRAYRLRRSADVRRVRALKRSLAHPLLVLYTAPNEVGHPRLAVSVGRRAAREFGKAVVRNRVRRRVGEAVRLRLADSVAAVDLLFVARGPSATADWGALSGAVDALLRRARLLPARPTPESGSTLKARGSTAAIDAEADVEP